MDTTEKILERDWSEEFDKLAKNRMIVSHYKYGWCSQTYPELAQAYKCIRERLDLYEKTGNMEYLVDIRNFAMIEFMHPAIEGAYFKAEDMFYELIDEKETQAFVEVFNRAAEKRASYRMGEAIDLAK